MACWLSITTPELKAFELIVTELTTPDHKIPKVMANHPGFVNRPLVRLGLFQLTTPELMVLQLRVLFQLFFKPSKKRSDFFPRPEACMVQQTSFQIQETRPSSSGGETLLYCLKGSSNT
jgi:hypothetical protein